MLHNHMEDKRMRATIENKSGVTLHGLKPGGSLSVETDRCGLPLEKRWRRRLADSKIDGAILVTGHDKELTKAIKADATAAKQAEKAAKLKRGGE